MVGDDFFVQAQFVATRAINIDSSPEDVFPWIRQMGFKKAGWYSYDIIDNLGRRSATRIHPEWQNVESGDRIPAGPISFVAPIVKPPHSFVLVFNGETGFSKKIWFTLAYALHEVNGGTRLVTRVRISLNFTMGAFVAKYLLGPADGFMVRKQLRTLASRCEQR